MFQQLKELYATTKDTLHIIIPSFQTTRLQNNTFKQVTSMNTYIMEVKKLENRNEYCDLFDMFIERILMNSLEPNIVIIETDILDLTASQTEILKLADGINVYLRSERLHQQVFFNMDLKSLDSISIDYPFFYIS